MWDRSPVVAKTFNAVAVSPDHLIAAFPDRERLPRADGRLFPDHFCDRNGIGPGRQLLVIPKHWFVLPVPALIAFATAPFAYAPSI